MKKLFLSLSLVSISIIGCKKDDMSKYATKEDLASYATENDNKVNTVEFNLTFTSSQSWGNVPVLSNKTGDVVLFFIHYDDLGGSPTWVQLPSSFGGIQFFPEEVTNSTFFINATKVDGSSGNPFTTNVTYNFKAVILSFSQIQSNPNVDLNNYADIKEAFNLAD